MPELPEVENIRCDLAESLDDFEITSVKLSRADFRMGVVREAFDGLIGLRVKKVQRRGKFLIFSLSDQSFFVIHLGMSGRLVSRRIGNPHDLFGLCFEGDHWLTYNDFRRFGRIWRVPTGHMMKRTPVGQLGVEPLSRQFTATSLAVKSKRSVKAILLDQHVIAGLGNIYACESLFHARIRPDRAIDSLSDDERSRLVNAIKETLKAAISRGGATLDDYRGTEGAAGDYDKYFAVFGREGQPCPRCVCATGVQRIPQQGRSSFFCPTFQV